MIEAATVNATSMIILLQAIEAMYPGERGIHLFCGQCPLPPRQGRASLAGATGQPDQVALHPSLLLAPRPDRAALGVDAQAPHPNIDDM